jgi:uncharacterized protein (UPF0335 family)
MSDAGHNSLGPTAKDDLKKFVERAVDIEEQKADLACDLREIYKEAKSAGFNVKVLRQIVKEQRMDREARAKFQVEQAELDTYRSALGMLGF